jgi:hypothetical protein
MTGIEFRIAGVVVKKKEEVLMARQMDGVFCFSWKWNFRLLLLVETH